MLKNKNLPFLYSHFGINDYDFWFNTRPLEETKLIFEYGSKLISEAGIHWDRHHLPGIFSWNVMEPVKGKYDWTIPDLLVKTAQSYNINLLPNLWLFAAWDQKAWEGTWRIKIDTAVAMGADWVIDDSCPIPPRYDRPHDLEAYSKWITTMVERYDGDGVDDMPGLKFPIKYWEPMNEVYTANFWVPAPITSHKSFAEMTKITYLAAKKADPECKIVLAEATERFYRAILELGKKDGEQYFDIVNLHRGIEGVGIGLTWKGLYGLKKWKNLMEEYGIKASIWFTEFGSTDIVDFAEPPPYPRPKAPEVQSGEAVKLKPPYPKIIQVTEPPEAPIEEVQRKVEETQQQKNPSPRRQAAGLVKASTIAFYNGVDKVFLRGFGPIRPPGLKLTEPLPESYGNYSSSCILDRDGRPRPVYFTAQLIMTKLDMFERIEKLELGKGVEAYKYIMDTEINPESEFLYILWSDNGESITLKDLKSSYITVTETVPRTDEKGRIQRWPSLIDQFDIICLKVIDGQVSLKLSEEPVIVEI